MSRASLWQRQHVRRLFFLLLSLVAWGGGLHSAAAFAWSDTARVIGNGTAGPYFLTGRPLLADSVRVCLADGSSPPELVCALERDPGRVVFSRAIAPQDTVLVMFSALPFPLRSTYGAARTSSAASVLPGARSAPVRASTHGDDVPQPFRLQLTGAKTFGISVDSRHAAKTEQGLQLGVDGRLTEGITLTAAVSDRFSDRLSSGASAARLDGLDNFFLAIKSPSVNARIGRLEYHSGALHTGVTRRLSGIELGVATGGHALSAAAGKLAGSVRRREFYPQAGRQGPYTLTDQRRPIVPQSESVYLDGRALERGGDRDYTIDYFSGEITFSPRAVLTERTRIAVIFEEGATTYLRRAAFANWRGAALDGRLANELGVQWEGDDTDAGLGFHLSSADRDTLSGLAGGELRRNGAVYVGPGRGEYVTGDTLGSTVYTYVGPQNGDHNVRFEHVGVGEGTYIHLGGGAYGYVGSGKGEFEPGVTISAPRAHLLVTSGMQLSQTPVGSIKASVAGLALQSNRLNQQARESDWSHDLQWSSTPLLDTAWSSAAVQFGAHWRRLGRSEQVTGGPDGIDVAQRWFLRTSSLSAGLHVIESQARVAAIPGLRFSAEYGTLAGSGHGMRDAETITAAAARWLSVEFNHERAQHQLQGSDTLRSREIWDFSQCWHTLGLELRPGLRREIRVLSPSRADRADSYHLQLGLSGINLGLAADRIYQGPGRASLAERRRRMWIDGLLPVRPLGMSGSVSASRTSRRQVAGNREIRDYLGQADLRWNLPQWGLDAAINYSLNQLGARDRMESFIPVAPGFGTYRREDSLLVVDPRGDLIRVSGTAGELRPAAVGRKELTARRGYGESGVPWLRAVKDFAADLRLVREEAVDPEQISVTGWVLPWGTLRAGRTILECLWVHHETLAGLERRIAAGRTPWFIRGQYAADRDRLGAGGAEHRRTSLELSGRGNRPGRVWSSWEIAVARQERSLSGYAGTSAIDALVHQVRASVGWILAPAVSASAQSSVEHVRNRGDRGEALIYGCSPSLTVRFGRRGEAGSVRAAVDYDYVRSLWNTEWIPSAQGGFAAGHNARCLMDGRVGLTGAVSLRLHSTVDWWGKRRPLYRFDVQAASTF